MDRSNTELPVRALEDALVDALTRHTRLILQAPTGSGKSTQTPQMLVDRGSTGHGRVVILQPRRLAARLLAARVAEERGVRLGGEVGYQIRFEDQSSAATRILFVTEGILLRQMLGNPQLDGIGTVIFDEFHERHVYGDITLGRALQIQRTQRPDLRIIVMSATLDAGALQKHLAPCATLSSEGRVYPVDIAYLDRAPDELRDQPWDLTVRAFESAAPGLPDGHVLVFMPGAAEIGRTVRALQSSPAARDFDVLPLHGEMAAADQDAAVGPARRRKIVVATNVAETSITIAGIRLVIDSGLARVARFDPYRGINTLPIEKISRASADQRAGRAGRTGPGRCLRLWTARDHAARAAHELPEIQRIDLAEMLLLLRAQGVGDLAAFPWLDPPEARALARAETLLRDLGACAKDGTLTPLGRQMSAFPLHPRYARMLLAAGERGCVPIAAALAALTQERSLLLRRPDQAALEQRDRHLDDQRESDFLALLDAWRYAQAHDYNLSACQALGIHAATARRVEQLRDRFLAIAGAQGLDPHANSDDPADLARCVLAGFSDQLARRLDGGTLRCRLVHNRKGSLDRASVVRHSPLLVAAGVQEIQKAKGGDMEVRLSLATAVEAAWLDELYPADLHSVREVAYDPAARRVTAVEQRLFRDLPLETRRAPEPTKEEAAAILSKEVLAGRLQLERWDQAVESWIGRLNFLSAACPDLDLPAIGDDDRRTLIEQACFGAFGDKDLRTQPVWPTVKGWLTPPQQAALDRYAPERLTLPGGRAVRIAYPVGQPPFIEARIEDLYDVRGGLTVARGRVPLVIHILAPNFRPVQITQDLANFWAQDYPRVKKELQRRYPKHPWR